MKKTYIVSAFLSTTGLCLIVSALIMVGIANPNGFISYMNDNEILTTSMKYTSSSTIEEVSMQKSPNSELDIAMALQGDPYSGQTVGEIATQLNKHLGKDMLMNKGEVIASYSISLGVDPYLASAIMLHETGCRSKCSALVRKCNNVAGQKGAPSCSGGYKGYASIDEGIKGAIYNLYKNYYAKGFNTVETIGPRYAESNTWVSKINGYIHLLKS